VNDARGKYRIQTVAEMTGIAAATLRAWERRYGVPVPARTTSSYRLYSDADVEMIRRVRAKCDEGMAPAEAARLVLDDAERTTPTTEVVGDPFDHVRQSIISAVEVFDPVRLERELDRAITIGSATIVVDQVLRPVMVEIGDRWHDGRMTVAQEHLATELATHAARRLLAIVQPDGDARTALLVCFADEEHAFPLHVLGVHMATWGWRIVVLGARTPPPAVRHAVSELSPGVVALSVTIAPSAHRARELVDAYADACTGVPWIVGGTGAAQLGHFVTARGGHVAEELTPRHLRAIIDRITAHARAKKAKAT
jgi:DNA-binding transcriptional MerR regulator